MMKPGILFAFLFLAVLLTSWTSESTDAALIIEVRENSNKAIAKKDTIALGKTWTADVHVLSSRNNEVSGRIKNQQAFAREFQAGKIFIRTPKKIDTYTEWKMAAEEGTWVGRWTDKEGPIEISGTYFAKWHKVDGTWLIRAEIFVPTKCTGGSFCTTAPF